MTAKWMTRAGAGAIAALLLLTPSVVTAATVVDLADQAWTLTNDARNISVPGKVPSQVHLDLFAAGTISDPYLGLNDIDLRWVALSNWTYTTHVRGLHGLGQNTTAHTYLLFNGLDTFANVSFCGQHVATTDNQFRQYRFNITDHVAACRLPAGGGAAVSSSHRLSASRNNNNNGSAEPELRVHLTSAPLVAQQIADQPGQETWPWGIEGVFEFPHRQFIRKEQSDFGWDWGPAFAPAGIWQPAWIHQLEPARDDDLVVTNVALDIHRVGQVNNLPPDQTADWVLNASIDVLGGLPAGAVLQYAVAECSQPSGVVVARGNLTAVNNTGDVITGVVTVPARSVALWWPNGMGAQTLYNVTVDVVAPASGRVLASVSRRTGFRTIVVNMEPVSDEQIALGVQPGNNWHFEINGHPFYAKGSNFVPPDAFWPRVTADRLRQLLGAAVAGHQNMLRVWASGVYGPDALYDLADELGLLLWSEFEFGDALYPVGADFLVSIAREAHYQVRRTVHHPSLAVWAGGNELENLELWLVNHTAPDTLPRYRGEYETLFLRTLLPAVYGNSRGLTYMPSSTNNGYLRLDAPDSPFPWVPRYNNRTAGALYGVTEWYDYAAADAFDTRRFPVGRFANEFGFHAMPSVASWREVVARDADLRWDAPAVVLRNHHPPPGGIVSNDAAYRTASQGMAEMATAIGAYYPQPDKRPVAHLGHGSTLTLNDDTAAGAAAAAVANFSAWCHASQVFQADWLRQQIFFYRAGSGQPNRQLGALYWQLNDVWQAPTWATVEYSGRWKVGHYATRDAFQPVVAATVPDPTTGVLRVYAVSDLWAPVQGVLHLDWVAWSGALLNVTSPTPWWSIHSVYGNHTATGKNITTTTTTASVSLPFTVGALNSTLVAEIDVHKLTAATGGGGGGGIDPRAGLLVARLEATGTPIAAMTGGHNSASNTTTTTTHNTTSATRTNFAHTAVYTPVPLKDARLVDPGLTVRPVTTGSGNQNSNSTAVEVQATTGTSVWTWLALADADAGRVVVAWDDNGFLLRKGETRRIGYRVLSGASAGWLRRVTVQSTWNDTLAT
ncbi:glycoside hydrolase family 2 protein [Niveomyces insectorum RCEF 264]|uniref:Beta-mannosidase A n=1 Tax=Niveomyces insectorum RCEF 264 TaxID=1081102 RepID=A0A167S1G1_9HYPO|nr:glycoside hydrolase family 2 protein [Niveomyces insectorum RCEF 264]